MTTFKRNSGQFHLNVYAVAALEGELREAYTGAGPYWANINAIGEVLAIERADDDAEWLENANDDVRGGWRLDTASNVSPGVFKISCSGGSYQLCVDKGTAVAALLIGLGVS